jgi:hypothetical protein
MYEPLHRHRPAHRWTYGDLAAKVGADLGLPPDDEQRWILDTIYGERAPERPSCFEVAVISPRQNIKTSTLGIAALTDLFVFGVEKHVWTAHHGDTLKNTFNDFRTWIKSNPEYDEQVTFYEGHQDMSIVHTETRNTIEFQSRTGKAGRGFTGVKRVTVDEALYLEPKHVGAIYPTMLTKPEAQVRIASSAGLLMSEQLRRIRERGRTGKDKRLAYVEYGAKFKPCLRADCTHAFGSEGCALDDRDLWWQANCALWQGRITEEALADQRESMPPKEFMREFLSWWDDPESVGGALPFTIWQDLADPDAPRGEGPVFGLDVDQERTAWIAVAWRRSDGFAQVSLTNDGRPIPAHQAVEECARLASDWGGVVAAPKAFDEELETAGARHRALSSTEFTVASGVVYDAVSARTIRHGNQPALNAAVKAAAWRNAGTDGSRAFQLRDSPEVGPLAAMTRALYALSMTRELEPSAYVI